MKKTIHWGIIGLGKIARKFAEDLLLLDGVQLAAVASRDLEKAKTFAEEFQAASYYSSYEELVADPEIDVVYIATPHVFHLKNTIMCLKANKAVLCEKAFAMNSRQVDIMIEEAKKRKLFLMEALWTRFIPATEKLMELINTNIIGEIEKVQADFGFEADPNPEKRVFNKKLGGGSLLDVGLYPVYLSLLLLGAPEKIKAKAQMTNQNVDGSCSMEFHYQNQIKAILESSIEKSTPTEAFIQGSKGTIKLHAPFHHTQKLTIALNKQTQEDIEIKYTGNGYYHEILEVVDCLRKGKTESKKMPHSTSRQIIATLDAIREKIGLKYESDLE